MLFVCVHSILASVVFQNKSFCIVQCGGLSSATSLLHGAMLSMGTNQVHVHTLASAVCVQSWTNAKPEHAKLEVMVCRGEILAYESTTTGPYLFNNLACLCTYFSCPRLICPQLYMHALLVDAKFGTIFNSNLV